MSEHVDLPEVDLGTASGRAALREGLTGTGFFLLRDHEVPPALLAALREETGRFFDRPLDEKQRFAGFLRGYAMLRAEHSSAGYGTGEYGEGDLCEKYTMGVVPSEAARRADPAYYDAEAARDFFAPNVFPDDAFGRVWTDYFAHMQALARRLMGAVREALDLPGDAFAAHVARPADVLRYLHYPEVESDAPRMAAHYDDNLLTLLHQSVPANGFASLQVMLPGEDAWRGVPADDGTIVVNVGDALMYLTGGRAVATKHRVVNPPAERLAGSGRTSIAFFHLPDWDCPLRPVVPDGIDRDLGQFAPDFGMDGLLDEDGTVPYHRLLARAAERGFTG